MIMLKILTENWALKVLSLVFALILWFFVMGERKLERSYAVPLEITNVPKGMMVANEVPSEVEVRINGPRTLLMNLRAEDMRITVDLKDLPAGLTSYKRLEERLDIPAPLKVTRLTPSYVDILVDRIRSKQVPVKPVLAGRPAAGFEVRKVAAVPESLVVEGAESELDSLQRVETAPFSIEGATGNLAGRVPLRYGRKFSWIKDPGDVEIKVMIGRRSGN